MGIKYLPKNTYLKTNTSGTPQKTCQINSLLYNKRPNKTETNYLKAIPYVLPALNAKSPIDSKENS